MITNNCLYEEQCRAVAQELADLRAKLSGEVVVKSLSFTQDDGAKVELQHWGIKLLAASLLDTFKEQGGKNFVTCTINSTEGPLEVTIRPLWTSRKTPADRIHELEESLKQVQEKLTQVTSELESLKNRPKPLCRCEMLF